MSDEDDAVEALEAAANEVEKEEGGNKKMLLIIIIIFLLGGAGAGLYFSGMLDPYLGGGETEEHTEDGHGEESHGGGEDDGHADDHGGGHDDDHGGGHDDGHGTGSGAFVPIPTMIVNLNNLDGTSSFLRLTVQLELENPSQGSAIEEVMPRVIDQFQTYLRELRPQDLRGSAGLYRLQMELLWRVNQAAAPIKVKDVLFQEILIQ